MDNDELTPDEREYLAGYLAFEPRPRLDAQTDTWAAIEARTQQRDEAMPRPQVLRASPRRPATAWVTAAVAVAAVVLLGWSLGRWRHHDLPESRHGTNRSEAAYGAVGGHTTRATTEGHAPTRRSTEPSEGGSTRSEMPADSPPPLGAQLGVQPQLGAQPQLDAQPQLGPQPQLGAQPQPQLGAQPQPQLGAQPQPQLGAQPQPRLRPAPRSAPASNLTAAELERFEDARRLARHGDPRRALQLLREHRRRYPDSLLAEERAIAEVQALCRKGDRQAARRLTERFIRRHSTSHLVDTMRRACETEAEITTGPQSEQ